VTAGLELGLTLALASAVALNWGFVVQHGAAAVLPPLRLRRPLASLRILFANARWLVGFLVGIGGWVLYIAALKVAPLSLVQAVSAGGIGFLALLVHFGRGGERLGRREWVGVGLGVAGLVLLAGTLAGGVVTGGLAHSSSVVWWLAASAVAAAVAAGPLGLALAGGAGLGIAAGILYAAGDVATKAALGGGDRLLFVPAVLAAHGLAFACLQLGFQRGGALATAGLATLLTNALPIAAGLALFHERLPGGASGDLRVLAFALVTACAALLARPRAD
jgi:drug/metabolite transporter (DMT)-like permease